jgi:PAS domain S-box-containing protein
MHTATANRAQTKQTGSPEFEESFRQIVDSSPDAIVVHAESRIVFANKSMLNLMGANSIEQLLDHSFFDFLHPDTKFLVKARIESARTGEMIAPFQHRVIPLSGPIVKVETAAVPMKWKKKDAVQIRLHPIVSDTEYASRLRESESLFHQLADAMPQIVWMANANGDVDYHNKKWFEQTGLTEEEANALGVWKAILHPDDAPLATENWNRCIRTGEPFQMEYRYKDIKSGGHRWHLGRALPVRDEKNQIVRWFGTCTDIHDQKLTELALHEAKEQLAENAGELEKLFTERTVELEEIVRSSEALNYSIAHDLRAPLRAMMGFSDTLLDGICGDT